MLDTLKELQKQKKIRFCISIFMVTLSAFVQVYIMQVFMEPSNLLSGGFTGISLLINKILALVGINFPVSVGIILLNAPAAILCYKYVSKRFTFLSCLQFGLVSLFLEIFTFEPFIDDQTLNVLFGGLLWGFSISLALRTGGSTGGTDFIAQFVSNKIHKGIWDYVFAYNMVKNRAYCIVPKINLVADVGVSGVHHKQQIKSPYRVDEDISREYDISNPPSTIEPTSYDEGHFYSYILKGLIRRKIIKFLGI